jgi:GDP-4-dehydro-6-deoxy-D-mannose reductase
MPGHLALGSFAAQIASFRGSSGTLRVGNIDVKRDFIDVEHVAALICNLAFKSYARGIINICSGEAVSLRGLLNELIFISGKRIELEFDTARLRGSEPHIIIGSTKLLEGFGERPPETCYSAVIGRLWAAAEKDASN